MDIRGKMIYKCEVCKKEISYKMARASETHCQAKQLCLSCQINWIDEQVELKKYPAKLADVRIAHLQKYNL